MGPVRNYTAPWPAVELLLQGAALRKCWDAHFFSGIRTGVLCYVKSSSVSSVDERGPYASRGSLQPFTKLLASSCLN